MAASASPPSLIGQAPSFLTLMEHVSQAAPLNRPTLVIGERGTGKELIAARLHYLSPRWDRPFVKLNCAALSETLLETELFGHEAGAFTGAAKRHVGRFELADGGTLFLDEIATSSASVQEKILRVIEYGEFERVGGTQTLSIDVRVVGATNADLPRMASAGKFRADLLDRLSFDVVTIPPLRARPEDIPVLVDHFGVSMARELGRPFFPGFTPGAMQRLLAYPWPGNVRELKNVVERAVYRAAGSDRAIDEVVFDPFESPFRPAPMPGDANAAPEPTPAAPPSATVTPFPGPRADAGPCNFLDQVAAFETGLLRAALERNQYHQKRAAAELGLNYHQFRGYLRKYNLLERRGASLEPAE
ncbi:MAG TPA: phage shock protein operon transcriptional activator [Azospirillaceae bacterium]|nr:phage shock protein operon transcriptional activator [Azospirillaceae bacterium]